ncbi:uncharacterized protein [Amphiura filiformis]|uniref:uncharacterized protein n=1 Tax=Amphiura filiformis TaxID=82378 RepID=UPI003B2189E5
MKYYSDRVISLIMLIVQLTGNKQLCVIQVYAPTSDYDDEIVEELYEEVNKAIEDSKADYTIVMGDFNAKIRECQPGEEAIMGNQREIVEDCSVITSVDIGSEHRMVRAKIHIDRKLARLKIIRNQKKSKLNILKLKELKNDFQLELKNQFACLDIENADKDTKYELISNTIVEAAEEIAPRERKTKQTTEEDKAIEELDKKRKEPREIEGKSPKQKIEYSELVKTVRRNRRERSRKRKKAAILESGKGPK